MDSKRVITQEEKMFRYDPIWKTLLKLTLPSVLMMLVLGSYFFFDNVLSINLANDSYEDANGQLKPDYNIPGMTGSSLVRIFMNGYSPINSLMIALALLFGLGISTRVAINMGKGNRARAINTFKTGFMVGIILAFVLTPILIFVAKPWISGQYRSFDPVHKAIIADTAFKYAWPVILSFALMMFNQIIPTMLRNEARMKEMLLATTLPIFVNLLLDWVFMGPLGFGVEGGAWATFTANALTTLLLVYAIKRSNKTSLIRWEVFWGFKLKMITIFGVILVGISPFLRNIAQSITSSVQTNIVNEVSTKVFNDDFIDSWNKMPRQEWITSIGGATGKPGILQIMFTQSQHSGDYHGWNALMKYFNETKFENGHTIPTQQDYTDLAGLFVKALPQKIGQSATPQLPEMVILQVIATRAKSSLVSIMSGATPVFLLFFPTIFAFAQGARPLASFNYGAGEFDRVRKVYWWTLIFATIVAGIIYIIVAFGLSNPLITLLKVENNPTGIPLKDLGIKAIKIMMLGMLVFGFAIAAMVIFGSTDRVFLSTAASSMAGLILFWPIIYPFKELAINHIGDNLLFFWYIPVLYAVSSIVTTLMVIKTLLSINKKYQITLDERIDHIYVIQKNWRAKHKELLKVKTKEEKDVIKKKWHLIKEKNKAKRTAQHNIEKEKILKKYYELKKKKRTK